jgi:hypothetical protein
MRRALVGAVLVTVTAFAGAAHHPVAAAPERPATLGALNSVLPSRTTSGLHNIAPSPDYQAVCYARGRNNPTCIRRIVKAIEAARSHERMKKHRFILPINYRKLSVARQTFVVTNLERVDRGLRPFAGLVPGLDRISRIAAALNVDPRLGAALQRLLGIDVWGSIWASDLGPLASDYDWMYNDGYGGTGGINLACPVPGAFGCWGHRKNILYPETGFSVLSAGAGTARPAGASIAEILTAGSGRTPRYSYTWKRALRHGANGHRIAARFRTR